MIPHCIQTEDILPGDLEILEFAKRVLGTLPDAWDCHHVCAEIAARDETHELIPVKGKFLGCDHSWLTFDKRPFLILDIYSWAASGPFLITLVGTLNPWRRAYNPLPAGIFRPEIYIQDPIR